MEESFEVVTIPRYHSFDAFCPTMSPYKATHIPYGVSDPSKRTIRNPGIKDEVDFIKYGIETEGEYFEVRTLVKPGGGE